MNSIFSKKNENEKDTAGSKNYNLITIPKFLFSTIYINHQIHYHL